MKETLGFIGLGIMGRPMAQNLVRAGYPLRVYARRPEAVLPLSDVGALVCETPAEVAHQAGIIFTMVSDTPDVEAVVLGAGGILEGARPGSLVVDMSTISPVATRALAQRLSEREVGMLDAPVSGGEVGAIAGTLSFMVGGPEAAFRRAKPMLEAMGKTLVHIGGNGAGQVCKACNQILVGATIVGVAEALLLAQAAGVDPAKVREALLGGFANSRVLEIHGQRMIEEHFDPGFAARLHHKDLRIVSDTAHALGLCLPSAAMVAQYLDTLVGQGKGELDSAAIYEVLRALNPATP
jgi:2-hydroxy-3-oxopropionate reductase